jgi:hypothetical protein
MKCMGYGEIEGKCDNKAVKTKMNGGFWCADCNKSRLATIDKQFAAMMERFEEKEKK